MKRQLSSIWSRDIVYVKSKTLSNRDLRVNTLSVGHFFCLKCFQRKTDVV